MAAWGAICFTREFIIPNLQHVQWTIKIWFWYLLSFFYDTVVPGKNFLAHFACSISLLLFSNFSQHTNIDNLCVCMYIYTHIFTYTCIYILICNVAINLDPDHWTFRGRVVGAFKQRIKAHWDVKFDFLQCYVNSDYLRGWI